MKKEQREYIEKVVDWIREEESNPTFNTMEWWDTVLLLVKEKRVPFSEIKELYKWVKALPYLNSKYMLPSAPLSYLEKWQESLNVSEAPQETFELPKIPKAPPSKVHVLKDEYSAKMKEYVLTGSINDEIRSELSKLGAKIRMEKDPQKENARIKGWKRTQDILAGFARERESNPEPLKEEERIVSRKK